MTTATQTIEDILPKDVTHMAESLFERYANLIRTFRASEDVEEKRGICAYFVKMTNEYKKAIYKSLEENKKDLKIIMSFGEEETEDNPMLDSWINECKLTHNFYAHCLMDEIPEARETLETMRQFQLDALEDEGNYFPIRFIILFRNKGFKWEEFETFLGKEYGTILYSQIMKRQNALYTSTLKQIIQCKLFRDISKEFKKNEC
jgi:hypothetical protein